LHQFCSVDMGGFYLDVLKDRLYTTPKDSRVRLSAQTAMHHILQAMVRWIAPILSFTAEEIWQTFDDKEQPSIFLTEWYDRLPTEKNIAADAQWSELILLRNEVNKRIESLRVAGVVGGSLDAEVVITVKQALFDKLKKFAEELKFVFIVSKVSLLLDESVEEDTDMPSELEGHSMLASF